MKARLYKYRENLLIERSRDGSSNFLLRDEGSAKAVLEELKTRQYVLSEQERKKRKKNPLPPFITSTLQQEASKRLGFTAKKTMLLAQQLYEGIEIPEEGSIGLITYMRTDSVRVAPEAQQWARQYIKDRFGEAFLPSEPPQYKSKKTAQEAHEAIRPTYPEKTPEKVKKYLTKDQFNLYKLIWDRFIASQMAPGELESTTYIIRDSEGVAEFRATGTVIKFPGFMALYREDKIGGESISSAEQTVLEGPEAVEEGLELPDINEGTPLSLEDIKAIQHFTQPPPRYTEASLVKALEEKGIGRPSTYATILSTIQERKYVTKVDGKFVPSELGILVNDLLVERFPELIDVSFTAKMEEDLDEIEEGKIQWLKVVKEFYGPFKKDLDEAMKTLQRIKPKDIPTDLLCEKCGLPMVIRWGRHGRFLACTGYPKCKNTRPLNSMPSGIKCPLDGGDLIERKTRKGRTFWSCSNYPKCKFATWYRPLNEPCPECGANFLVIRSQNGEKLIQCIKEGCKYSRSATVMGDQ